MSRYQQDLERGFIMTAAYDHACERRPLAMPAWQPPKADEEEEWADDPIHWAPRMSNRSILRDLIALAWKAIRR